VDVEGPAGIEPERGEVELEDARLLVGGVEVDDDEDGVGVARAWVTPSPR